MWRFAITHTRTGTDAVPGGHVCVKWDCQTNAVMMDSPSFNVSTVRDCTIIWWIATSSRQTDSRGVHLQHNRNYTLAGKRERIFLLLFVPFSLLLRRDRWRTSSQLFIRSFQVIRPLGNVVRSANAVTRFVGARNNIKKQEVVTCNTDVMLSQRWLNTTRSPWVLDATWLIQFTLPQLPVHSLSGSPHGICVEARVWHEH